MVRDLFQLETRLPEFVLWWRQENVAQERLSLSFVQRTGLEDRRGLSLCYVIFTCAGMEIPRGIQVLLSNGGVTRRNIFDLRRGESLFCVEIQSTLCKC